MMSIWAPNATLTAGPGVTRTGKKQIRDHWLDVEAVPADDSLDLRDPRVQDPGNGERRQGNAVLRVPLHRHQDGQGRRGFRRRHAGREDRRTVADHQHGGSVCHAEPLRECPTFGQRSIERAAAVEQRRPLSRGDNPLVRAVGRLPVKVHTKLLIAFVGTAVLLVAVGLLGQRVLGQSNDRVGSLGGLQKRAIAYGTAPERRARTFACSSRRTSPWTSTRSTRGRRRVAEASAVAVDLAVASALARIGPATRVDGLGFEPPAADEDVLRRIRLKSGQLSTVMQQIIKFEGRAAPGEAPATLRHRSEQLAIDLNQLATVLANATTAKTDDLIAQNASAYASSRNLFIGVAAARSSSRCCSASSSPGRSSGRSSGSTRAWLRSPPATSPATSTFPTATSWARSRPT